MRERTDGEHTRPLSPVLTDESLVVTNLTRRVRIVLGAVVVAFVLGNLASYVFVVGVANRIDRDREILRAQRDRQLAEQKEQTDRNRVAVQRMRGLVCVFADRLPRDAQVQRVRAEFGCTGAGPSSAPSPGGPDVTPRSGPAVAPSTTESMAGPARVRPTTARPPPALRPPVRPVPQPTAGRPPVIPRPPTRPPVTHPPEPPDDDGLICLPIVGCVL